MKMTTRLIVFGSLLAIGAAQVHAQTNVTGFQTNLVMTLTLKGTAYVQSDATTVTKVRWSNKDFLNKINADQGSNIVVTSRSKLVFAFPLDTQNTPAQGLVRIVDGTNSTPVGDNLNIFRSDQGPAVVDSNGSKTTDFGLWRVSFATSDASFEAQGFGTFTTTGNRNGTGSIDFSGTGTIGGNPAVVSGTATSSGKTLEVQSD